MASSGARPPRAPSYQPDRAAAKAERRKPQRKGNVGEGKLHADEAAFKADADKWDQEWQVRDEQVKDRERVRQQLQQIRERGRDRSDRKRDPNNNARRVKQKQAANPNVLPPDVVNAFNDIVQGEVYKWCEGHNISPAIVADGLQPPQCRALQSVSQAKMW